MKLFGVSVWIYSCAILILGILLTLYLYREAVTEGFQSADPDQTLFVQSDCPALKQAINTQEENLNKQVSNQMSISAASTKLYIESLKESYKSLSCDTYIQRGSLSGSTA